MSRDVELYLSDLITAVERILDYTYNITKDQLDYVSKTLDAVVRNFEILGEAAKNMPAEIREEYSAIPWSDIIAMRNKISHEYFAIDIDQIWKTITEDLPPLKHQLEQLSLAPTA